MFSGLQSLLCFGVLPVLLRVSIHLWHRPVNCDHMGYGIHSSLRLVIETNIGVSILHIHLSSRYRTCSQVSLTALLNILYNYVALTFFLNKLMNFSIFRLLRHGLKVTMIIFSLDVIRIVWCNVSFVFWSALHFFL